MKENWGSRSEVSFFFAMPWKYIAWTALSSRRSTKISVHFCSDAENEPLVISKWRINSLCYQGFVFHAAFGVELCPPILTWRVYLIHFYQLHVFLSIYAMYSPKPISSMEIFLFWKMHIKNNTKCMKTFSPSKSAFLHLLSFTECHFRMDSSLNSVTFYYSQV